MPRPRISAISFLNTAPLMWDFEHTPLGREYEITYTLPSLCAEALRRGQTDVGLIPAVTYCTIPDLMIVPDVAIAARGPVRSILLVSKIPLERVRTVAADTSSRTSVVLCDLLFRRWFPPVSGPQATGPGVGASAANRHRQIIAMAPDLDAMLAHCDAALLIGDSALRVDRKRYLTLDLAQEWRAMTAKPFVFAFWAARREVASASMAAHFRASRDHGLRDKNLDALARQWAPRVGISEAEVHSYLSESISYSLDAEALAGFNLFLTLASEEGLIPAPAPLRFIDLRTTRQKTG